MAPSLWWCGVISLCLPPRREYRQYLRRPDHKQEFLVQWQQNYNALPTHLRAEDVMKAELHCRVDVSHRAPADSQYLNPGHQGSGYVHTYICALFGIRCMYVL